jgi:hydrogenase nickel incorporation protein HypA/HybF
MHELAICHSVLRQVASIAANHGARHVGRITLRIGPLAGVEPDLLRLAFPLIAAGTVCDGAIIEIEHTPVQVRCKDCSAMSDVRPNRLLCASCGTWRVTLVTGDEMLLARVELLDMLAAQPEEPANV